ncbi:HAD family hydrolase [uncultured Clostridium sp.]|uniref:HAD family hydrolase n=1 Tax=uncultured Clostridium sp. TaxID=59620 RepID=UPI00262C9BF7|nr:HAD family hydrolase [uncultured Clostridium sp.]
MLRLELKSIKYIFFDVGYTLINEDKVWEKRCLEQSETEEAKVLGLSSERIYEEIIQASLAYKPQYKTVVKKFDFKEVAKYNHSLEELYEGADLVLSKLSSSYKLGIIANQTNGLVERLESLGILKYFSIIISSSDCSVMKPDPKIFEIAVEKSGCKPEETIMIGDRLDNDIFPAKQIGMKTIWIKQGFGGIQKPKLKEYIPNEEISKLEDLLKIFDIRRK